MRHARTRKIVNDVVICLFIVDLQWFLFVCDSLLAQQIHANLPVKTRIDVVGTCVVVEWRVVVVAHIRKPASVIGFRSCHGHAQLDYLDFVLVRQLFLPLARVAAVFIPYRRHQFAV